MTRGKPKNSGEKTNYLNATVPIINTTQTEQGANPDLRSEMPATNRLFFNNLFFFLFILYLLFPFYCFFFLFCAFLEAHTCIPHIQSVATLQHNREV
jgi:hypothetical protein